jgi:hypothetical protein
VSNGKTQFFNGKLNAEQHGRPSLAAGKSLPEYPAGRIVY